MIQKALVCTLLVSLSCTAQNKTKTAPIQKYLATITQTDLKKHLTIVASDEMEGRDTGTEGQKKAFRFPMVPPTITKKYPPSS
jgi:hypothetical protein